MRFLIYPLIGSKFVLQESNFLYWKRRIEEKPEHFYYIFVPEENIEEAENVLPKENVKVIGEENNSFNFFIDEGIVSNKMIEFSRKLGKYPIDAVLTSRLTGVPAINNYLRDDRFLIEHQTPVIVYEPGFIQQYQKLEPFMRSGNDIYKAIGCFKSTVLFLTNVEREYCISVCKKYLSYSSLRKFYENSYIVPPSIDVNKLDEKKKNKEKNDKLTLFFGGRMNKTKKVDEIFKTYSDFFAFGRDVNILFNAPGSASLKPEIRKYNSEAKIIEKCSKDSFLENANKADIFLCMSDYEGFPVGFFEIMYLGAVGILPKKDWSVDILGEDYPFLFKNQTEAETMLRYVADNLEESRKKIEPVYDKIRKYTNVGSDSFWKIVYDRTKKEKIRVNEGSSLYELVKNVIKDKKEFSFEDILKEIVEASNCIVFESPRRGIPSRSDIYDIIKLYFPEFKDTCKAEYPYYIKQ